MVALNHQPLPQPRQPLTPRPLHRGRRHTKALRGFRIETPSSTVTRSTERLKRGERRDPGKMIKA